MKGRVPPRGTAASANLSEVLMAAVTFEGTHAPGAPFVGSFRTSRAGGVFRLTRAHSSLVEVRRSCAQKSKHILSEVHTLLPCFQTVPSCSWPFKLHPWPHTHTHSLTLSLQLIYFPTVSGTELLWFIFTVNDNQKP